jgi:hypothetical protein
MFDDLRQAVANAETERRVPEGWRFSPEGWEQLRQAIAADSPVIQWTAGARIETVLGLPYAVTCQLPPDVAFELV